MQFLHLLVSNDCSIKMMGPPSHFRANTSILCTCIMYIEYGPKGERYFNNFSAVLPSPSHLENWIQFWKLVAVCSWCTHPHTWSSAHVPHQTAECLCVGLYGTTGKVKVQVLSGIPFLGLANPPRSLWKQDIVKTETCCFWHERLLSALSCIQRGLQLAWPALQNKYSPL